MLLYDGSTIQQLKNRRPNQGEQAFLSLLHPKADDVRRLLGDVFGCHEMVIADCLRTDHRPKLNVYDDHAFFPFFFLTDDWTLVEIFVVMGPNFVIAILNQAMPFLSELQDEFKLSPKKMGNPGRMLYEFLDLCIHHYIDFVNSIEDTVDEMENKVYDNPEDSIAPDIFSLKRKLHRIRRIFSEERAVIESLMHSSFPYTKTQDNVYFMDLFDHINRIVDGIDSFRDALSGLLDLQMAIKSDRMNSIMKTLTIISSFFMPMSFIVGLYGTNVKVPEYGWRYGYLWVWALVVAAAISLAIFFKRKKWF